MCHFLCMQVFLYRAVDLGLRLSAAFESASGIPFSDVNLRTHATRQPEWTTFSSLSEATTLSLEFATLAQASGVARGQAENRHLILSSLLAPCGVRDTYMPAGVDSIPLVSEATLLVRNPRTGRWSGADPYNLLVRLDVPPHAPHAGRFHSEAEPVDTSV